MQPTPQHALIDRLRAEFGLDPLTGAVSNNRAFRNLENAVRILSEQLNTELAHFLLELVQNADDLKYKPGTQPSLIFRLIGNQLLVVSNETGFTERDVESICSVGDSTKAGVADQTGEKGIGFKSLFKASEEVTIASNGFHFQFSLHRPCGSVVPEWKELPKQYQLPQYSSHTIFLLTFGNQRKLAKVKHELLAFDAKLLLFLRRLKLVEIEVDGKTTRFERRDAGAGSSQHTKLETSRKSAAPHTSTYAIVTYTFPVTVMDEARKKHTSTAVTLAFPLGGIQEDCHAYNCLPICTTGFPFLLQGDFILSASREGLNETSSDWNDMVFEGLAEAFLQAVGRFNASRELKYTWLKYLPRNPPTSQFKRLSGLIQEKLQQEHLLLTQSDHLAIPSQVFFVPKKWRDSNNEPLIQGTSLSPPDLSCGYDAGLTQHLSWLGCRVPNSTTLLLRFRAYIFADRGATFKTQSISRLSSFAQALLEYGKSELEALPIVPVKGGQWVTPQGRILFFGQNANEGGSVFNMPRGLPRIEVLESQYVNSSDPLRRLFSKLGVQQGTVSEVCKMIEDAHSKATPPSNDSAVLIQHALYLFKAWRAKKYLPYSHSLKPLWLCTESGAALLSRFMYQPVALVEKSLLEYVGHDTSSRHVMHPDYMSGIATTARKEFSKWFAEQWKVFTGLRICTISPAGLATSERTKEFQALLSRQNCDQFLEVLVNSWRQNFGTSSPPSFISNLGTTSARWALNKNEKVRLSDTFLPVSAVKALVPPEVPLLNVIKPDDPKWQVLSNLSVTTTATSSDPNFWLACLRFMMKGQPGKDSILAVYEHLNSICSHQANVIRPFFEKNAAIFVPSKKAWIKPNECIWSSKHSLRHKLCVGVKNAQMDDIIAELEMQQSDGDEDHEYLKSLFLALQSSFKASSGLIGVGKSKDKLRALRSLSFVPLAKTSDSETMLRGGTFAETSSTPDWFIVDSSRLQDAFREVAWLLDFSLEESQKLRPFIKTLEEVFVTKRPGLTSVVKEQSQRVGQVTECTDLSQLLRTRSAYLGSAAKAGGASLGVVEPRTRHLANARVFQTDSISTSLTIDSRKSPGGIIRGGSRLDTDIMLEDSTVGLNVYILRRAAALGNLPPSTGDSLGNYLCVTSFEHLHLIGHILMAYNQRDIRDLLVSRGIAVDSNEGEDEEVEPPTNDMFETSQVQHQAQSEPSPIVVETSLPLRTSKSVPVVEAASSRGGGRGGRGRGRGRGGREIASSSRPAEASSHSPDPAARVTATAPLSNGIPHSSGPRRTDGASRAVEITAAQKQDPKTGIEGELKVYSMLKNVLGDEFTEENWTSELRHLAVPKFKEWKPKDNTTFYADFTFVDKYRNLTEWLKLQETIEASASVGAGQVFRYHIEVKATNGKAEDPYHMSDWQFEEMKRIAQNPVTSLADGTKVVDKFLIFRVSDLSAGEKPGFAILGEPWNAYANGRCRLRAPGGMWITWN